VAVVIEDRLRFGKGMVEKLGGFRFEQKIIVDESHH
jgi:hypothetical protein